jgi:hypothetical protein
MSPKTPLKGSKKPTPSSDKSKGNSQKEQPGKGETSPLPSYVSQEWPLQTLLHGSILGVEWNGGGGEFKTNKNSFAKEDVDIAIGRNSAEATASLLALEYDDTNPSSIIDFAILERALTSFNLGFREELNRQDGDFLFEQTLHRNTFLSIKGEYTDEPDEVELTPDGKPTEEGPISLNEKSFGSSPSYFYSRKPVMNLTNTRRSTRHDEDKYHDGEGLKCRISNAFFQHTMSPQCNAIPNNGGIPNELHGLTEEMAAIYDFAANSSQNSQPTNMFDYIEQLVQGSKGLVNFPSTKGVNGWSQAWIPLFVDVKYKIHDLDFNNWKLGKSDFKLKNETETLAGVSSNGNWVEHVFRSPITTNSASNLADKIKLFKDENSKLTIGKISGLSLLARELSNLDISSITLDFEQSPAINNNINSSIAEIQEITIIDAFGQLQSINTLPNMSDSCVPEISLSLQTEQDNRYILNKPRFTSPARVKFRFIDAENNQENINPVCGFILCDHLEWAIEVFDNNGDSLGQLSLMERNIFDGSNQKGRTKWDPAPGQEVQLGKPSDISNRHLRQLFNHLIELSIEDITLDENNSNAGILACFMRLLDSTMDTVYTSPTESENLPSLFAGRPICIARAELEVEINEPNSPSTLVNISLGSIERTLDGLLGYFIGEDYTTFYSVSNSSDELYHPFISHSNELSLVSGEVKQITLVFDPLAKLTARSGLVPERILRLKPEYRKEPLSRIAPTYRFGPLLIDPTNIAMPLPSLRQDVNWTWINMPKINQWSEDNISNDSQSASIPQGRIKAWNGWLKIDPIEDP